MSTKQSILIFQLNMRHQMETTFFYCWRIYMVSNSQQRSGISIEKIHWFWQERRVIIVRTHSIGYIIHMDCLCLLVSHLSLATPCSICLNPLLCLGIRVVSKLVAWLKFVCCSFGEGWEFSLELCSFYNLFHFGKFQKCFVANWHGGNSSLPNSIIINLYPLL